MSHSKFWAYFAGKSCCTFFILLSAFQNDEWSRLVAFLLKPGNFFQGVKLIHKIFLIKFFQLITIIPHVFVTKYKVLNYL